MVYGSSALLAHEIWAQPLGIGTNNAVFVEDCVFTKTAFGNAIDAEYGGKYVFRHNILNDVYIEAHSIQGNDRAARSWEIYDNAFNQSKQSIYVPIRLRGGTGVVFNNTFTGTFDLLAIGLDNVRSCTTEAVSGLCDGSSVWDGNQAGQAGYPCRDQIGRSTDSWLWTASNLYPPQQLDPAYEWNNYRGSTQVNFASIQCAQSQGHIQENRDFYNGTAKPGYTPYIYPHPLAVVEKGGVGPARNLRIER